MCHFYNVSNYFLYTMWLGHSNKFIQTTLSIFSCFSSNKHMSFQSLHFCTSNQTPWGKSKISSNHPHFHPFNQMKPKANKRGEEKKKETQWKISWLVNVKEFLWEVHTYSMNNLYNQLDKWLFFLKIVIKQYMTSASTTLGPFKLKAFFFLLAFKTKDSQIMWSMIYAVPLGERSTYLPLYNSWCALYLFKCYL